MKRDFDEELHKDVIAVSVEKALVQFGNPVLDEVESRLSDDYNIDFRECLEKPEFLQRILREYFGESYKEIISTIKKNVEEFTPNKKTEEFLHVITNAK